MREYKVGSKWKYKSQLGNHYTVVEILIDHGGACDVIVRECDEPAYVNQVFYETAMHLYAPMEAKAPVSTTWFQQPDGKVDEFAALRRVFGR